MANYHVYGVVENLALTAQQRDAFMNYLRTSIAAINNEHPEWLYQSRVSVDGQWTIFEALYDELKISPNELRSQIASILGLQPARITETQSTVQYAPPTSTLVLTYLNRNTSQNVVRIRVFGGYPPNEQASHREVLAYLSENAAAWGIELPPPE
jgi:hypothetical protein